MQTTEAFFESIQHVKPLCVGLNCALGATQMRPFLERLSQSADCFVHAYPNAGLPNAMGGYDDTPEQAAPRSAFNMQHAATCLAERDARLLLECCRDSTDTVDVVLSRVCSHCSNERNH
jgi:methionine synthase I (cobalamin-dependent)